MDEKNILINTTQPYYRGDSNDKQIVRIYDLRIFVVKKKIYG